MKADTLAKALLFCTVRITQTTADGREYYGTGFLFDAAPTPPEGEPYASRAPLLITNKHLLYQTKKLVLEFLVAKPGTNDEVKLGEVTEVHLEEIPFVTYYGHPDDDVDVAAIPLLQITDKLAEHFPAFYATARWFNLPTPEAITQFDAIEDLVFIGYPDGIKDAVHHTPIVRSAITATPLALDFDGRPAFLVDGAVFEGSSGSPVFVLNRGMYAHTQGHLVAGERVFLVGIIAESHFRYADMPMRDSSEQHMDDEDLVDVDRRPFVRKAELLDLGLAFNAQAIIDTINVALAAGHLAPGRGEQGYV